MRGHAQTAVAAAGVMDALALLAFASNFPQRLVPLLAVGDSILGLVSQRPRWQAESRAHAAV